MKPFIIGDKRYAFDVTNANDLCRLERAFAKLCAKQNAQLDGDDPAANLSASEQMRIIFGLYRDFFDEIFPGRGTELIGDTPSVSHAGVVFDRFTAYLHACIAEEEQNARMMRRLYLGDADTDGGNGDGATA